MHSKNIIRIVLLGVVAIAVGSWAMKEFGPAKVAVTQDQPTTVVKRPDGVTVINFHGKQRCRTCIRIGELAKKTVTEDLAAAGQADKLHWEHLNYDEPANAHFVKEYELVSSTVVATLWKDGREITWRRLDDVWDLVGDEAAFRAYIASNVNELLEKP
jgi:hypothetical protein